MDGNRRFAVKNNLLKEGGYSRGFGKILATLRWCKELGIKEITVYAFSIENFKRSRGEVKTLMTLAGDKIQELLTDDEIVNEVCVRIIGNMLLWPEQLKQKCAELMLKTKDNDEMFLNVAFVYTSRDEIANSAREIVAGVKSGAIEAEDIDEGLISDCLYTSGRPDPELIIRTSGEIRFSDFLLWQISHSQICFLQVLWPDVSFWYFLVSIIQYQRHCNDLKKPGSRQVKSERVRKFLDRLQQRRLAQLQDFVR
ncbi:Prenyltransf domain containing protein [Asbolus verrucosus]|uniref:Alkyl transferase n=1 Tax=Asbolus verrucosus TaxID=1661398 RepID=A0A482WE15_ASBVE|nr:Prenyltransf domain containing protein [Asbolus verrucosus]